MHQIENVRMIDRLTGVANAISKSSQSGPVGTLYLTPTHLIFVDREGRNENWVLHSHLAAIEKQSVSSLGTPLQIRCKNFQSMTFLLPKEKDAYEVLSSLLKLSQPVAYQELYCFRYSASNEPFKQQREKGWNKYDYLSEFRRQGVPNKHWLISDLNSDYALCQTYPRHLLVPASATEHMLRSSAAFRSNSRIPVLSYWNHLNGAAICRCSQPLSGPFDTRSKEDEQLMDAILRTGNGSSVLYIVDTRPRVSSAIISSFLSVYIHLPPAAALLSSLWHRADSSSDRLPSTGTQSAASATHNDQKPCNRSTSSRSACSAYSLINSNVSSLTKKNAYANKAAGKGFENENYYENMKFYFFGIENIHVMRGSLAKLLEGQTLIPLTTISRSNSHAVFFRSSVRNVQLVIRCIFIGAGI